jgi:transposase
VKQYVGLDVSQKVTSLCVIDELGRKVWTGKCASTPKSIAATVAERAPQVERVGLETGPLCVWHYHGLKALGVPVLCLDARHAKAALSMQVNKTDDNDAEGLAQVVRTGWYREVFVKSFEAQRRRSLLQSRAVVVSMRRDLMNQVRGSLKVFGVVLGAGGRGRFDQIVRKRIADRAELSHRRRGQIQQNAQTSQLLTVETQSSVTDTAERRRHRPVSMHGGTYHKDVERLVRQHPAGISQ